MLSREFKKEKKNCFIVYCILFPYFPSSCLVLDFGCCTACMCVFLDLVVLELFSFPVIKKCLPLKVDHDSYKEVPMQ